jgi:membrane protein involved in colicin uptake
MFGLLMRLRSMFLFEAADPAGGGSGTTGTDPGGATDPAKKTDADPVDPKTGKDVKDKKPAAEVKWTEEQQAEIDRIMGLTRDQERKKAKADFDAEVAKAQKEAEEKQLTEKQEFKTLAEKRQTEIETLKAEVTTLTEAKEQGDKYKAALEANLKAQTEKLPAHIKTLLSKLDVLEQMEYLTKNAKDLGVKLDSIDATPPENQKTEADLEKAQSTDLRRQVKSWT